MSRSLNNRGNYVVEVSAEALCSGCLNCVVVCPDIAIQIDRTVAAGATARGHAKRE